MFVKNNDVKREDLEQGLSRKILARGGKMMLVEVTFKKGAVGYLHSHPHEQISYIQKGSFEVEINGEKRILKAGDSFYAAPDVKHGVVALEDSVIIDVFTPQRDDFL
jgi:quercetin dioxygenase-like cupin family protein